MARKEDAEKKTLDALKAEKRVMVYLPSSEYGPAWVGSINGVPIMIGTDQQVEVSESVAALIANNRATLRQSAIRYRTYEGDGTKVGEM